MVTNDQNSIVGPSIEQLTPRLGHFGHCHCQRSGGYLLTSPIFLPDSHLAIFRRAEHIEFDKSQALTLPYRNSYLFTPVRPPANLQQILEHS